MTNTPLTPPPGMVSDDTVFSAPGRWRRGSWVRFWQGNWEVKGGWERLLLDNLGGVCRTVFGWQDQTEQLAVAFGLHNGLKYWQSGTFADITPLVSVSGDYPALSAVTFIGTTTVGVREVDNVRKVGDVFTMSGAPVPFGGTDINGTHTVTSIDPGDPDVWYYGIAVAATADANTAGTVITITNKLPPGMIDGTGGVGYGTGAYGVGEYGEPSLEDYFPLTWSLAAYGGDLMANPRGRTIYRYSIPDPVAVALANAPEQVTFMLTTPSRQVLAFGCNESVSGVFNPLCIRWSDIENPEVWAELPENNAGEWVLESGGRIVCARTVGDYVLVWTSMSLFLGTFIGDPGQTWKFERVGANCGAIGPNAPIIRSQVAAWISPDRQLWSYALGGAPTIMDCPIRAMFHDNISQGQDDKIVGASVSSYGELSWFYPDARDGMENSRAITVSKDGWHADIIPRSAFTDAGPQSNPIGVSPQAFAYWHEKGHSADGAILQWFLESTDFYIGNADGGQMVNGVWPDFKNQIGVIRLSVYGRDYPQAVERTYGPWAIEPGRAKKSFRMASRIARIRLDGGSAPAYARGGSPQFDLQQIGGR